MGESAVKAMLDEAGLDRDVLGSLLRGQELIAASGIPCAGLGEQVRETLAFLERHAGHALASIGPQQGVQRCDGVLALLNGVQMQCAALEEKLLDLRQRFESQARFNISQPGEN